MSEFCIIVSNGLKITLVQGAQEIFVDWMDGNREIYTSLDGIEHTYVLRPVPTTYPGKMRILNDKGAYEIHSVDVSIALE